jgi:hypothetical protein
MITEFMDALVEHMSNQTDISNILGEDTAAGDYRIGAYVGDAPAVMPYLSIRISPSVPLTGDSNATWTKTRVMYTAHSTNPLIATKLIDYIENLLRGGQNRAYMDISNDRIANANTSMKRRWYGQKAGDEYDQDTDVWMDMVEVEMVWSPNACRDNPFDIEIPYCPYAQDQRPSC